MSPAHRGKFVAYYRVSTDRQGKSGLGLAAQQAAVRDYLNGGSWQLVAEHTEIETGKRSDRPELLKALEACRRLKAKLVIAKLDRLTRNTKFLLTLMDSGVDPVFCDFPQVPGAMGRFMLTQMVAVAELEAGLISERTKAALQAARARGTRLGNPRLPEAAALGRASLQASAARRAANVLPVIRELQQVGFASHNAIAAELNRRGVKTARGGRWTHVQVGMTLARAG